MLSLREVEIDTALAHCLSRETAERPRAIPFHRRGDIVEMAMSNPEDVHALDEVRRATRLWPEPVRVADADIAWAIETLWSGKETKDLEAQTAQSTDGLVEADAVTRLIDAPAIVRLASVRMTSAVDQRASDIHIEPQRQGVIVRYRIDGVRRQVMNLDEVVKSALISRIKIMAHMDIADSRLPQEKR